MRILTIEVKNFASYGHLSLSFKDKGLVLIQGATGSGKSTVCDAVVWLLFGRTAKNGTVDEVLSWPGDKVTEGTILLELNNRHFIITRTRGKGKNDLWFNYEGELDQIRGKDLNDTQNLINNRLNLNVDLFLSAAYYHEFSQTAQFFVAGPKVRRIICEQLIDLSLAKQLQEKTKKLIATLGRDSGEKESQIDKLRSKCIWLTETEKSENLKAANWQSNKIKKVKDLEKKAEEFELRREHKENTLKTEYEKDLIKLRSITICTECGASKPANKKAKSPLLEQIHRVHHEVNYHIDEISRINDEANPYEGGVKSYAIEIKDIRRNIKLLEMDKLALDQKSTDAILLSEIVTVFRSRLVEETVEELESSTNKLLAEYFDAELHVEFSIEAEDKLDITIQKDSNNCSYTQLSKGQRQMLKLCFAITVMRMVANHHGTDVSSIFLDEAFDGLDEVFKAKSYQLLKALETEYENVFVVEHSENFKALFDNKIEVQLINGNSVIDEKAY